jgi:hypothetical protein
VFNTELKCQICSLSGKAIIGVIITKESRLAAFFCDYITTLSLPLLRGVSQYFLITSTGSVKALDNSKSE